MEKQVQLLCDRVAQAELTVFGPQLTDGHEKKQSTTNLTDELLAVNTRLANLSRQHEVVQRFWTSYGGAMSILNARSFDDAVLPTSAKEEIILSAESALREIGNQLQELDKLGDFLNTPAQQDLPSLFSKISPLEQAHISSRDDLEGISKRSSALLASYNEIVALLSRKFVLWDQVVSSLERKVAEAAGAAE